MENKGLKITIPEKVIPKVVIPEVTLDYYVELEKSVKNLSTLYLLLISLILLILHLIV